MKKGFKRIISGMFIFMMTLALSIQVVFAAGLTISQSAMTVKIGESVRLTVNKTGTMWISSNPAVASVDQMGNVTGKTKGSAVITASDSESSAECVVSVVADTTSVITRYNVMIIDTSGSVKGKPFATLKQAAKKFAQTVLKADGKNYVAVVALNNQSKKVLGLSRSITKVKKAIDSLKASGNTNMNAAFKSANAILKAKKSGKNVIKNIVLCSDGLPQTGAKSTGRYKKSDHENYLYANATYNTDVKSKKAGSFVYALGFFHNSKGKDLVFGKRLMKDLASKNKYYIITKVKDVDQALKNIAQTVTSTTISKSKATLYEGQSTTLQYLINGVSHTATWTSGNASIAKVDAKGKVSAIKAGKATITGTYNGKSVKCVVTVLKKKTKSYNRVINGKTDGDKKIHYVYTMPKSGYFYYTLNITGSTYTYQGATKTSAGGYRIWTSMKQNNKTYVDGVSVHSSTGRHTYSYDGSTVYVDKVGYQSSSYYFKKGSKIDVYVYDAPGYSMSFALGMYYKAS